MCDAYACEACGVTICVCECMYIRCVYARMCMVCVCVCGGGGRGVCVCCGGDIREGREDRKGKSSADLGCVCPLQMHAATQMSMPKTHTSPGLHAVTNGQREIFSTVETYV